MDSTNTSFSVISYNLHGINKGASFLHEMCDKNKYFYDCVCVQEHWLTLANLSQISNFNKDYTFYGISAMESKLNTGLLRGRPFSGTGILLKNCFCKEVILFDFSENYVVLVLKKAIIISIYLPCSTTKNRADITSEILEKIKITISPFTDHYLICAITAHLLILIS